MQVGPVAPLSEGSNGAPRYMLTSPLWALVALLAGLLLTAWLGYGEWNSEHERVRSLQHSLADAAPARLQEPLAGAALGLRAMQTVLLADAERLDQATFAGYQRNLRAQEWTKGYVLTAFAYRQLDAAGKAAYRYRYVAPLPGNEMLLGFDNARQPENMEALLRARDGDIPALSAPFTLLQFQALGEAQARGVTIRMPAYRPGAVPGDVAQRRARELGSLAVSVRLEPLVREALRGRILDYMEVDIRDLHAMPAQALLYATAPLPANAAGVQLRRMTFGGRVWELRLWPRAVPGDWGQLKLILIAGSSISVLLALFLWSQLTTHRRAIELGRRMSARFGESEARFQALNELLPALVLVADGRDRRISYANQAARTQLGNVVGESLEALFADRALGSRAIIAAMASGTWSCDEAVVITGVDGTLWVNASLAALEMEQQPHLLLVASDTSAQREMTEQLRYQAAHDELTGLCNRREFERRLRLALNTRGKQGSAAFALLYIDLDQFKLVNDLSGHMAGDQLLVQLAQAMRGLVREQDLLARLGGDEFGMLAFGLDPAHASQLAEQVRACIERSTFVWHGRSYTVSASIGLVWIDGSGCTLKDVLAWADSACYQAKEDGRNRVHVYRDDADSTRRLSEMEWASRLRQALEQDRLLLDYQEIVPLAPGAMPVKRVELLLRMRADDGSVVAPGVFLVAAERYGLMPAVDRWVIRSALANFAQLHPCGDELQSCAINLSGASLEDEGMADFILDAIARHHVQPQRVCLEITETVAVRDLLRAARMIERLRGVGCRIALDDFGAGMASFGYLKNLPVDVIKIDGSFVRDLGRDPMSRIIIEAVARIGHQRGARVVAEWVDDLATLDVLRELGVDSAQGYALHRPERVMFQRAADEAGPEPAP